ncbi:selenocysteine lyase/cysteine desulfurase [Ulvibacter sp. MAR_2010_11]|uniref:aminotransferase class V-fold PLP-dependent enzyme n=1 Tax=Ulvibacter sp. MAR_2010_11 TaxID=1250229 RepID=UPI000C2C0669|nr:aminotransferase class V-fold PLP-dependent enzyme [Ulvibacter sp. MAR_2010_11]PKA83328.1 selenocysteine lyase/cysteine desulfurase [Ulvibacter sp. MAR_2010_11]
MEDLRKEFPVLSKYIYLNTASSGLISKSLVSWRQSHDIALHKDASVFRDLHKEHIKSIRRTAGRFFGAAENEIALLPNYSFGLNTLLEGLPKSNKVLLLNKDYPSINWPFEQRGFQLCYTDIDENLENNILQAVAEHQPDVFAFSIVQYLNGIKLDFDFLKQLKAYHPNLLLVADGTQYLGTEVFNFSESPIDVLGASCYKWLLAGYGNGVFMIKTEAQSKIHPSTIGFNSADAVFGNRDEIPFMKHFEPGHQDTLNYGSLEQAILNLEAIGMEDVSEKIATLSKKAKLRFTELGLLEDAVVKRSKHSNIFNIKGDSALFQKLKEQKIICSERDKGIRVSFHFYNTEADLETLCKILS